MRWFKLTAIEIHVHVAHDHKVCVTCNLHFMFMC